MVGRQLHLALVCLGHAPDDRQPQAGAMLAGLGAEVALEHQLAVGFGHAGAAVGHPQAC